MKLLKRIGLNKLKSYISELNSLESTMIDNLCVNTNYIETLDCAVINLRMALIELKIEVLIVAFCLTEVEEVKRYKEIRNDY